MEDETVHVGVTDSLRKLVHMNERKDNLHRNGCRTTHAITGHPFTVHRSSSNKDCADAPTRTRNIRTRASACACACVSRVAYRTSNLACRMTTRPRTAARAGDLKWQGPFFAGPRVRKLLRLPSWNAAW